MADERDSDNTAGADGLDPSASNDGGAPAPQDNDLLARLAHMEQEIAKRDAELSKVRDESAKRRVANREAEAAKARALQEQGEFKALAETLQAQIAERDTQIGELEALRDKASRYDAWEKRELDSIETAKAKLPEAAQVALDAAGSLEAKRAFLNALNVKSPAAQASASAGAGAAPSPVKEVDFSALHGRDKVNAIKKNPDAFWGGSMGKEPVTAIGRALRKRQAGKG